MFLLISFENISIFPIRTELLKAKGQLNLEEVPESLERSHEQVPISFSYIFVFLY